MECIECNIVLLHGYTGVAELEVSLLCLVYIKMFSTENATLLSECTFRLHSNENACKAILILKTFQKVETFLTIQ